MNTLRRNMAKAGYDQEEAYFFQRDQELIAKMRERPKLELIKGGKEENVAAKNGDGSSYNGGQKKAA